MGTKRLGTGRVNISKHISISILFFVVSISCILLFYCWISENNCPGGGILARFFCPRDRGFALSLYQGGGKFGLSKKFPRGIVRLGID